ncbi:hypothetical protein ISP15_15665 [Dyella jejuensis]|uniref:Uncharacterized protein n=1 Tax=Dyella jejuensis TaxID=1432009 RepID=A0ABW8JPV5_9GAMM
MTTIDTKMDLGSDTYRTLLESWNTSQFTRIGPQIEALPGWTPDARLIGTCRFVNS